MNTIQHLKGNFLIGTTGVILSYWTKTLLKIEFFPVSSVGQVLSSFSGIVISTVVGKIIMYNLIPRDIWGFEKVAKQGFIGPLTTDGFPFIPENPFKLKT